MKKPPWTSLVIACVSVLALACGLTIAFLPLSTPAAGGTCGPGNSSEPAIVAFFDPGSIGAGPEPSSSNAQQQYSWLAFVAECQSSSSSQMLTALLLVSLAGLIALGAPLLVRRIERDRAAKAEARGARSAAAGWYQDPQDPRRWRWWDGTQWGPPAEWQH